MPLSCPLCSVALSGSELEGHLRLELSLPLLKCAHCPQRFCGEADAQAHFVGPFARHPDVPPDLIRCPEKATQTARLLELLRLARGGHDFVQQRLCVCGHCRLLCRDDFRPGEPASRLTSAERDGHTLEQKQAEPKAVPAPQEEPQPARSDPRSEPPVTDQPETEEWFPTEVDQASEEETPMPVDVKPSLAEIKPQLATDGKVSCLQCGKRRYSTHFAHHVREAHIPGRPYQCFLCPENSKHRAEMVKHQKKDHGVELNQETCSETVTKQALQDWIKLCFGEVKGRGCKTVLCRPCDKSIPIRKLRSHITTVHLKKPLYRCKTCDYSIVSSDPGDMNQHVKKVHKLQPGPDTVDRSGMDQYAPIIKAMVPQLFQM